MSDTRAAIRELRSLGEKRSTQGLTDQEQSRLAELRERLGLPSEPAQSRSGGPRPGSAPSTTHPVAAVAVPQPPAGAVALPKLGAPVGPAALPSFAPVPAPEPDAPALVPSPGPRIEPAPAAQQVGDLTGQSLPDLEAAVLGAMVQGITPAPADAPADLAPDLLDPGAPNGGASLEAPPELPTDDLSPPTESAALDALPELPTDGLSPPTESGALDALPELTANGLSLPTESAALDALPELPADDLSPPTESAALEALTELPADGLSLPTES
ncbi:MAG: hypothetical protein ACXWK9_04895, partial [Myxococcaceae bacterium]